MTSGHGRTDARTHRAGRLALLLLSVLAGCIGTETTGEGPGITGGPPPARPPGVVAPSILTTTLPAATVGQPYLTTLYASGGAPPMSWTVPAGTLPAGLTLDRLNGVIAGTPAAPGTFLLDVTLATSLGAVGKQLTLVVE